MTALKVKEFKKFLGNIAYGTQKLAMHEELDKKEKLQKILRMFNNKNVLNLLDYQKVHGYHTHREGKSYFLEEFDDSKLLELAELALLYGTPEFGESDDAIVVYWHYTEDVGINRDDGLPTRAYAIVLQPNGWHAYPVGE